MKTQLEGKGLRCHRIEGMLKSSNVAGGRTLIWHGQFGQKQSSRDIIPWKIEELLTFVWHKVKCQI